MIAKRLGRAENYVSVNYMLDFFLPNWKIISPDAWKMPKRIAELCSRIGFRPRLVFGKDWVVMISLFPNADIENFLVLNVALYGVYDDDGEDTFDFIQGVSSEELSTTRENRIFLEKQAKIAEAIILRCTTQREVKTAFLRMAKGKTSWRKEPKD